MKGKGNINTTPTTTAPAFALNGKAVPTTSSNGAFDYVMPKPPISTSTRPKNNGWTNVGKFSVPTTPISSSFKGPKVAVGGVTTTGASSSIGDGSSTSKGSKSPSTASLMKGINNEQQSSPSKQPKPTSANFNKQTGNKYQALSDLANGCDGLSAQ